MIRSFAIPALIVALCFPCGLSALETPAPVEARVPFAPGAFVASDGLTHLAYELHITNFYGDTGPLTPERLEVFADTSQTSLLTLDKEALGAVIRPAPAQGEAVSIPAGKRAVVFVWLTLQPGHPVPRSLRHRVEFHTERHAVVSLDGVSVQVDNARPMTLGPPLRGGRWLAHEGPGAAHSHHWGSLVAVNGALTIPQRFALDLVGIDQTGLAMHPIPEDGHTGRHLDWVGYGWDVIAVADGTVRSARDGQPEHPPLTPQPEPDSLTADGLFGNYVVLELAPGIFASYAHLKQGSVKVRPGDRVRRGQLLAQLGQSGNSAAPHLHFQVSNAATFEGAEGIPYVFERFDFLGAESEAQLFGQGEAWTEPAAEARRLQLPLNDVVIRFPDR